MKTKYQRLLKIDLVPNSCDAWFQFDRRQEVLFRLIVPPQLRIQKDLAPNVMDNRQQSIIVKTVCN